MVTDIEALRYNETVKLPKFKASLDRLFARFDCILTAHHLQENDLAAFVDKAVSEGNAMLIEKEYCGYCCTLWKD